MKLDSKALKILNHSCVELRVGLSTPSGMEWEQIDPVQVTDYIADPEQFTADFYGVSLTTYRDWIDTHGAARCSAKNKKGTDCKRPVSGSQLRIHEWIAKDGDFCRYHMNF